jgi:hypothetical protein
MNRSMMGVAVFGFISVAMLAGCGGEGGGSRVSKKEVNAFGLSYHEFFSTKKAPPKSLDDVAGAKASFPALAEQIKKGDFIVIWNADLMSPDNKGKEVVLGYEKIVPEKGGIVLLTDGGFVEMNAAEFNKLPKAATAK